MTGNGDTVAPRPEDAELPRLRTELQGYPQIYDGQPYWVVKDPLSLRYYRFNREEYFIMQQLRRGVTLAQLKQAHRREFRSDRLNNREIALFISDLTGRGLISMTNPQRDELLYRTAKKRRWLRVKAQASNFMFFRVPLYDPDKLFNRMIKHLHFIWTPQFFLFYLALAAAAFGLIVNRWHDFWSMFGTYFFTLYNIPIAWLAVMIIKGLHEFGHGLTCKHYGGEVHEMGWLFLVFQPFLYCNVTDSWTFPDKARRLLVTAGGMMTEIMFASVAVFIWYFTEQPSLTHSIAFNVIVACSISTIMFNANPLLKFDGYYIMMDLIEVPNLRQRASEFVRNLFVRYILGGHPDAATRELRFRYVFPLYAVAAYIYRWFIVCVILFFVYSFLETLHLVWLGRLVVVVSMTTMMILPLVKGGQMVVKQREALGISTVRVLLLLVTISVCALAVLFWPLQQHVTLNFVLEPAKVQWVRTDVEGTLYWAQAATEGAWLDANQAEASILARLDNPRLFVEQKQLAARIDQVKLEIDEYRNLEGMQSWVERSRQRYQTLLAERQKLQDQIVSLQVKVPFSGQVLSADRKMKLLQGRFIPRGTPLCLLADTGELVAKTWVPEKTLARIFRKTNSSSAQPAPLGQTAECMLYAFSKETFTGSVISRSDRRQEHMGEFSEKLALSHKVGGEVLTEYDPLSDQERPVEPVYEVAIKLDNPCPAGALPYMSGRTRIDCGRSTLYQWGKDSLLRFISPELRL